MNIAELFLSQCERRPDAVALAGSQRATYREVEDLSGRIAHALLDSGCRPGDRVALLAPKDTGSIAGAIAVFRIGCVLVPIDLDSPAERVKRIMKAALPIAILGHSKTAALIVDSIREFSAGDRPRLIISLDSAATDSPLERANVASGPVHVDAAGAPPPVALATDRSGVAQLLFTSGSTGEPKGVMVRHDNVVHFIEWANRHFELSPGDRISAHSPMSFDLSTWDIFGGLAAGAEVHLVDPRINMSPKSIIDFIASRRLTQWFSVPTLLAFVARFKPLQEGMFPDLKRLIWCGEVISPAVLEYWMTHLPEVRFTNLYGPTETTIASTFFDMPRPYSAAPVPIGFPCDGEEVFIVDEQNQPVADGSTGQILICGSGVTSGYWNDSARTDLVFVDVDLPGGRRRGYLTGDLGYRDEDGCIHFKGRKDSQIKCRGHRIELGEIEAALLGLPSIADAVVSTYEASEFSGVEIGCAIVLQAGVNIETSELRAELAERLPRYMLPSRWKVLDSMPTNVNGKVNRPLVADIIASA